MSAHQAIDAETIRNLFDYVDGRLFWKQTKSKRIKVGDEAGCLNAVGYMQVGFLHNGKKQIMLSHRIVFLHQHGYLPKLIDHINLDKTDNRIENLREATHGQNFINKENRKDYSLK